MTVTASLQGDGTLQGTAIGEQLIPRIPDEITLDHIATKMSWRDFHVLSSVSRGWLSAIRSHRVHDARARSHSTDTLVIVVFSRPDRVRSIALYSMKDHSWILLPPIPHLAEGIPRSCRWVSLDGKVYVIGGAGIAHRELLGGPSSAAVYVLDVAGQRQWTKCASMRKPRQRFGCAVMNGKIYVFGGISSAKVFGGSEVYDPKGDVWSPIEPMVPFRVGHRVEILGEEFFLHDGYISNCCNCANFGNVPRSDFVAIYHPTRDEWREIKPFGGNRKEVLFVAQGKFYSVGRFDHQYHVLDDVNENSWTWVPAGPFREAIEGVEAFRKVIEGPNFDPVAVLAVEDELLVVLSTQDPDGYAEESCLVESRGWSGKGVPSWQEVAFPPFFGGCRRWYKIGDVNYVIEL